MKSTFKYVLDAMFLFMLVVSFSLFVIDHFVHLDSLAFKLVERIDLLVLSGYYVYFFQGLHDNSHKLQYVREHWVMAVLLLLPLVPFARFARVFELEYLRRTLSLGQNTVWHFLDEIGLL